MYLTLAEFPIFIFYIHIHVYDVRMLQQTIPASNKFIVWPLSMQVCRLRTMNVCMRFTYFYLIVWQLTTSIVSYGMLCANFLRTKNLHHKNRKISHNFWKSRHKNWKNSTKYRSIQKNATNFRNVLQKYTYFVMLSHASKTFPTDERRMI